MEDRVALLRNALLGRLQQEIDGDGAVAGREASAGTGIPATARPTSAKFGSSAGRSQRRPRGIVGRRRDRPRVGGCGSRGCVGRACPRRVRTGREDLAVAAEDDLPAGLDLARPAPRAVARRVGVAREQLDRDRAAGEPLGLDVAGRRIVVAGIRRTGAARSLTRTLRGFLSEPSPTTKTGIFPSRANSTAASGPAPAFCPPSLSSTTPASDGPRSSWINCCNASPSRVSVPPGWRSFRQSVARRACRRRVFLFPSGGASAAASRSETTRSRSRLLLNWWTETSWVLRSAARRSVSANAAATCPRRLGRRPRRSGLGVAQAHAQARVHQQQRRGYCERSPAPCAIAAASRRSAGRRRPPPAAR